MFEITSSELEDQFKNRFYSPNTISTYPGWNRILKNLLIKLDKIDPGHKFKLSTIKEKFGRLRIYGDSIDGNMNTKVVSDIYEAISVAEKQSSTTCEECGAPGGLRNKNGWFKVKCKEHKNNV